MSYDRMDMTQCEQNTNADARERVERLWKEFHGAMHCLEPETRAAFLLHEIFEASYEEIAMLLGLPEETCRCLVESARAQACTHKADGPEEAGT